MSSNSALRHVDPAFAAQALQPLVEIGETFGKTVRCSAEDLAAFAAACHEGPSQRPEPETSAACGDLPASGSHASAMLMGLAAAHLSRRADGIARQMRVLHFNFAFKAPVHAGEDIHLQWKVSSAEWSNRLGGCIAHLDGHASTLRHGVAVVGRGTVLVKEDLA